MSRVIAIVEGPTEQTFVRNILAPHLGLQGVMMTARLVGKPGRKGGIGSYNRARRDVLAVLRQDTAVFCTTLFDFYGMPPNWPHREVARTVPFGDKATLVENGLQQDIAGEMGPDFQQKRFIPYVQMHEFEALLFSSPAELPTLMQQPEKATELQKILDQFESPEQINDHYDTAPSRRLQTLFPQYNKVFHGTLAAQRIGLAAMRQKCPHFSDWLTKLEALSGA